MSAVLFSHEFVSSIYQAQSELTQGCICEKTVDYQINFGLFSPSPPNHYPPSLNKIPTYITSNPCPGHKDAIFGSQAMA